ncbi:MAG: hypothetical protein ACI9UA_005286, partial [Pseudoalteromonas tetraodonis]
ASRQSGRNDRVFIVCVFFSEECFKLLISGNY